MYAWTLVIQADMRSIAAERHKLSTQPAPDAGHTIPVYSIPNLVTKAVHAGRRSADAPSTTTPATIGQKAVPSSHNGVTAPSHCWSLKPALPSPQRSKSCV
ncbi:hypothetical protein PHLCEN_2v6653 [Hermanssonia centrifuga]|uniref:Uncharacterized protein n=1 Tax=Hermanssonia centrifuga TaxID=98765 RepID=A0A2R6NZH8_9APHY|nr:hypothetical protein PHLCEN_2v6653 [Hermanssonia centrifuga]